MKWLIWAFVAATIMLAVAEVLIPMEIVPTIYDETMKLHIIGTGFDADEKDIMLEIKGQGSERLERGGHFTVRKFSDGVVLHLNLYVATLVESILPVPHLLMKSLTPLSTNKPLISVTSGP
jgi:hypothetical protein